jgi:hypothetical protein
MLLVADGFVELEMGKKCVRRFMAYKIGHNCAPGFCLNESLITTYLQGIRNYSAMGEANVLIC